MTYCQRCSEYEKELANVEEAKRCLEAITKVDHRLDRDTHGDIGYCDGWNECLSEQAILIEKALSALNGTDLSKIDSVTLDLTDEQVAEFKALNGTEETTDEIIESILDILEEETKPTPYETGKAKAKAVLLRCIEPGDDPVGFSTRWNEDHLSWDHYLPGRDRSTFGTQCTQDSPNRPTPEEIASGGCFYTVGEDE